MNKAQGMALDIAATDVIARDLPAAGAGRAGDSLLCALLGVYLCTLMLEGVLRYALAIGGVPNAMYLRDAIPVATLVVLFLRPLLGDGRINLAIAIPAALLAFHAAYAAVQGVALFSIAFGLKIFMFIPYGIAMWPLVRQRFDRALTVASIIFAITLAGVIANFIFGTMPWEGLEYGTAFGSVTTTRLWWTGDEARLPGFARSSFNAAMILGITGVLALLKFRRPWVRLAIVACAIAAIVLTTSKGMVLGFTLAACWLLVQGRNRRMTGIGIVSAVCAVTLALPFIVVYFELGAVSASSFPSVLRSVWDRFADMWPLAFRLLPEGLEALLGAGLGSIGTPQMYGGAAHHFNSADNIAVFMMINFGLPGLCYYAVPAIALPKVAAVEDATVHRAYVGLLLITYGYGIASNMVEESFFAVFFGLCCGVAASVWLEPES